ncbi:hypothetical protein Ccrd_021096 [Cynara cardunculus var. scolymus]|uniref:Uncharacterized protein n=1 Tax=Cynara cardunculus var. scolymus TaxID=59895 RepID=A0A103Y177_CYNCS|nr:hypothetical protein Ccrd_021096 [Cynara cardunculus var. scolymus]
MSSPPPSNPPTTTTTAAATATADFFKSVARQRPRKHVHPAIYQTFYNHQPATTAAFPPPTQRQQPQQQSLHSNLRTQHQQSTAGGLLYPVASSGRGFLSKHQQPSSDQNAAVGVIANSDGFPPRPVSAYPYALHRPYGFSNSDIPGQTSHQLVTPSSAHLQPLMGGGAVMPTVATGVSVSANPKVVGQSPVADDNSLKNIRDKNGDDSFVIIRDRKVQVSEGTSLYAQCRSWLKNGFTLENQPQYVDCVKSLPKPLPASMVEARKEDDMEIEEELLQQHVKHAKKVRVRLRNQRLQRIERYKDRLALLLPPVVDQQPKNDPTS